MEEKPEYFRLHEEEDRTHFAKLQRSIEKLPCKEDLDNAVKAGVEIHVNGKIREVHETLIDYIKEDTEWKKTATPAVISYQKGSAFFSVLGAGTQYLLPLFGLMGIIYGFISWLR